MPTVPNFPSIPVASEDPKSLLETVNALKQAVELLTGQNQAERFASHVFMDHDQPTAINKGDLWIFEGAQFSLNVWNGFNWIKIADLITPVATFEGNDPYFQLHRFIRRRGSG